MSPDVPASLDDRYFGPIPAARSSAKPSRYRPSRSSSAAIPVQAANENSSAWLLHPPPHSGQLSVRSRRLDSRLTTSRHQSSPLVSSVHHRSCSRPERHRHDIAHVPGVNRGPRNTGRCSCIRCDSDGRTDRQSERDARLDREQSRGQAKVVHDLQYQLTARPSQAKGRRL
jgi:hypothetical protein